MDWFFSADPPTKGKKPNAPLETDYVDKALPRNRFPVAPRQRISQMNDAPTETKEVNPEDLKVGRRLSSDVEAPAGAIPFRDPAEYDYTARLSSGPERYPLGTDPQELQYTEEYFGDRRSLKDMTFSKNAKRNITQKVRADRDSISDLVLPTAAKKNITQNARLLTYDDKPPPVDPPPKKGWRPFPKRAKNTGVFPGDPVPPPDPTPAPAPAPDPAPEPSAGESPVVEEKGFLEQLKEKIGGEDNKDLVPNLLKGLAALTATGLLGEGIRRASRKRSGGRSRRSRRSRRRSRRSTRRRRNSRGSRRRRG
tara:strand:+ start:3676 stop:4602 length:927 start_codon:yes stop_codon:yes gene_type:complete